MNELQLELFTYEKCSEQCVCGNVAVQLCWWESGES